MYQDNGKRLFDVSSSLLALVVVSPIFLLVAALILLEDGRPILFTQDRVGRDQKYFRFLKFRSMPVGTANVPSAGAGGVSITRVGRWIRRTNIDELPQLINILKGDMSVVGPRPAIPSQEELLSMRVENGASSCAPGLTGLAQINSYDGMPEIAKARYDWKYARNVSFLGDLGIIIRTIGYLFRRPPVY